MNRSGETSAPHLDDPEAGLSAETSHPDFVAAAPEWFFDGGDPRAPFSSDSGHDTLSVLEEHFRDGVGDEHVPGCVADLVAEWGLVPEEIWGSTAVEVGAWLSAEPCHRGFLRGEIDLYCAAACGQFKISGWIHPALRFWAEHGLALLEDVVLPWEAQTLGADAAEHAEAMATRLATTRAVIAAAPEPPEELQLPMYRREE